MINRLGTIEDKSTVCDYDDEEKQRSHSIHSALAYANYKGKLINIVDAPGYPDFVGAALLSIPAADAAVIVISASGGIEMNTRKHFEAATRAGKPRIIVINKMDAENVDLPLLLSNIQATFGTSCRCANLPSADKKSVIDCVTNDSGDSPAMDVAQAHTELVESIVEADDALMESYLGGEAISREQIAGVFVKALLAGTVAGAVHGQPQGGRHHRTSGPDHFLCPVARAGTAGGGQGRRDGKGRSRRTRTVRWQDLSSAWDTIPART